MHFSEHVVALVVVVVVVDCYDRRCKYYVCKFALPHVEPELPLGHLHWDIGHASLGSRRAAAVVVAMAAVAQHQQEQQQQTRRLQPARVPSTPSARLQVAWPPAAPCSAGSLKLLVEMMGPMMVEQAPQVEVLHRVAEVAGQVEVRGRRVEVVGGLPVEVVGKDTIGRKVVEVEVVGKQVATMANSRQVGRARPCQSNSS